MSTHVESPYISDGLWLRGNCHTHTTNSDGRMTPQEAVAAYAELGHDFLCLSDHDALTDVAGLDSLGLVLVPSVEFSGNSHMLGLGVRSVLEAPTQQELIDAVGADHGLSVLCHPNWLEHFNHYPYEMMLGLTGFIGIEIFNGVCIEQAGNHLATDKWDRLLSAGRRVWGLADDDAHAAGQVGQAWNVVRARERSVAAILEALRTGSFYASCGVTIRAIAAQGPRLRIEAADADRIVLFGLHGARRAVVDGPVLDLDLSEVEGPYVRAECYGRGGATAWTQPFFIRDGKYDRRQKRLAELGTLESCRLNVLRAERAPRLTGRLDDPLWRQAPVLDHFMGYHDGETPPVRTEVRCILAGGTLYFGLRCQEPRLEEMKLTTADGGHIWTHDSVELFLDVDGLAQSAYHFMVSAAGHSYAALRGSTRTPAPQVQARSGRWEQGGERGWSAELAVPVEPLGASTAPGARWGLHVCRNRCPQKGAYVANWVCTSNHNLPAYGSLLF